MRAYGYGLAARGLFIMMSILTDPLFYMAAIPAVILSGLAKGGLAGLGVLSVPVMALVVAPVQAAAIMLPILIVMDIVSLWAWRGVFEVRLLSIMLPGALLGIGIGWLAATVVTADHVRLIIGGITLLFFMRWLIGRVRRREPVSEHHAAKGFFWGSVSGFTSFLAHAGGPPYQIYAMPLKRDPVLFTGTSVIFFAVVNAVKLIPYFALGQLDSENLVAALILMPIAPVATLTGARLVRRMSVQVFYPLMYGLMLVISVKLIHDGMHGIGAW